MLWSESFHKSSVTRPRACNNHLLNGFCCLLAGWLAGWLAAIHLIFHLMYLIIILALISNSVHACRLDIYRNKVTGSWRENYHFFRLKYQKAKQVFVCNDHQKLFHR